MRVCALVGNFGAVSLMPALRVSGSMSLRWRLKLILGKGVWGKPFFIESARAGAEGYPPNIRNPKGEATFTRCFPKA